MKKSIKLLISVGVIIVILSSVTYFVHKSAKPTSKSDVAKVNGEVITKGELDEGLKHMRSKYKLVNNDTDLKSIPNNSKITNKEKKEILYDLIDEKLLLQNAKATNSYPSDNEVNNELKKSYAIQIDQAGTEENLIKIIKSQGYTKESYTNYLKNQILVLKAIDLLMKDFKFDENLVQQEYDKNKTILYTVKPNYMDILRILLPNQEEAKKVKERLDKGEDFTTISKEISTSSKNKNDGGKYYYDTTLNPPLLDPAFFKVAMSTSEGKVSDAFETKDGWSIIKCTKREEFSPKKFDEVKEEIRNKLYTKAYNEELVLRLKRLEKSSKNKIIIYDKNL